MAGTNNTFKNLQDYEIAPPSGLFAKLWKKIKSSGHKTQNSQTGENDTEKIITSAVSTDFSQLKTYISPDLQPPPFDFHKIKEAALKTTNTPGNPPVKINKQIAVVFKLLAAASITGVAFLLYYLVLSGNQSGKSKNDLPAYAESGNNPHNKTKSNQNASDNNQDNSKLNNSTLPNFKLIYANGYISKNGNSSLVENDFIYTFTNFTYDQSISFLKKLKKDKLISLNSYSYLNISEKMAEYLKGMYEVNDKDKPTRKSKKLKAKLAKWKKKDESYFDRSLQKNPLDIIDLGEFILK